MSDTGIHSDGLAVLLPEGAGEGTEHHAVTVQEAGQGLSSPRFNNSVTSCFPCLKFEEKPIDQLVNQLSYSLGGSHCLRVLVERMGDMHTAKASTEIPDSGSGLAAEVRAAERDFWNQNNSIGVAQSRS